MQVCAELAQCNALVQHGIDGLSRMRLLQRLQLRVTLCSAHGLVVQETEYDSCRLANYHTALRALRSFQTVSYTHLTLPTILRV